jgi:DNA-binding NarL/FixJ family response regulator
MRVIIADDAPQVRSVCRQGLTAAGLEVAAEATSAAELIAQARKHRPDAVLVDICLRGYGHQFDIDGLEAAEQLHLEYPSLGILIYSVFMSPSYLARVLKISEDHIGYLGKDRVTSFSVVIEALSTVAGGGTAIDEDLLRELLHYRSARNLIQKLPPRRQEALMLLARGKSNKAIAEEMGITEDTVQDYISKILAALEIPEAPDVNKRVLAVLAWLRENGALPSA